MAIGWGEAVGEGAEAFGGALHQTLNYKVALGLQQLRVGMEKEKLAMDKERQALEMEQTQQAIDLGKIKDQEARADLKAKLRDERLIRKGEHFISQAKSLEKMAGRKTPSGKPSFFAGAIPEISAGRKLEAYDLADREAPLAIKNLAEEEALTPEQIETGELKQEKLRAETKAAGRRNVPKDKEDSGFMRIYGSLYKDFLDYQQKVVIANILRQSQKDEKGNPLPPLPEIKTFEEYILNITPGERRSQIAMPSNSGIAPEDSTLFR